MKQIVNVLIIVVILLCCSVKTALAYDFEVDGIYYNVLSEKQKAVEVTYRDSTDTPGPGESSRTMTIKSDYAGDITIPSEVNHNGVNYVVKRIGNFAFFSGKIMIRVMMGDRLSSVDKEYSVTSIVLPPTLESIGYMSFACTDISSIEIPANVTYHYQTWDLEGMEGKFNPFMRCDISKVIINDNAIMPPHVFYGCGVDTLVLGENVTFVDADNCPPFTSELALSFLDHVETLPIKAFHNWTCLYDVSLPPKMSHIPESLFSGAVNLTELKLSKGIKSIGKQAFRGLSIRSIDIPEGLERIDDYAFADCSLLNDVHIPGSLTYLGKYAFSGCSSLAQIKLPEGLERIDDYAFADCSLLNDVHIPGSLAYLGKYAFSGCSSLTQIILPLGLAKLEECVFQGCAFETIDLPHNLTSIGSGVFRNCARLKNVILPEKLKAIEDGTFLGCTSLEKIDIPLNVKLIGLFAFSYCQSLKTIQIPAWATISSYAFEHCANLETITIPDRISNYAFAGCQSLKEIYINNPLLTPIDEETFTTTAYDYATLYVPEGTSDLYKRRRGWLNFFFIKEWDAPDNMEESVWKVSSLKVETEKGKLTIQGVPNGSPISVYNMAGMQVGYAVSVGEETIVYTNLQVNDVAIVKVGAETMKIVIK
ncbi:MAG: leucine-rich repeat protein [Bacteroidaceae bacterium]|nr:leucine-rich repeat protein [Bacteroidaceae bacterium]